MLSRRFEIRLVADRLIENARQLEALGAPGFAQNLYTLANTLRGGRMMEGWLNSEAHDVALVIDNDARMLDTLLHRLRITMAEHRSFEDTILVFVAQSARFFERHANMTDRLHKTDWTELASHYAAKLADMDANQ